MKRVSKTGATSKPVHKQPTLHLPGSVSLIEGSASLATLPLSIMGQLEDYCEVNKTTFLDFAHGIWPKDGDSLERTGTKPTSFVVAGTDDKLEAARYRYAAYKALGKQFIVVQDPSMRFNGGNPAIVVRTGSREWDLNGDCRARWEIWTPNGSDPNHFVQRLVRGSKKPSTLRKNYTTPTKKDESDKKPSIGKNIMVQSSDVDTLLPSSQRKRSRSLGALDDPTISLYFSDTSSSIPRPQKIRRVMTPTRRSQAKSNADDGLRDFTDLRSDQVKDTMKSKSHPHDGEVSGPNRNTQESGGTAFFVFKTYADDRTPSSKPLSNCNTVQKLFAYAAKYKLITNKGLSLSVKVTSEEAITVIRDDEEDFDQIVQLLHNHGDDDIVEAVVMNGEDD